MPEKDPRFVEDCFSIVDPVVTECYKHILNLGNLPLCKSWWEGKDHPCGSCYRLLFSLSDSRAGVTTGKYRAHSWSFGAGSTAQCWIQEVAHRVGGGVGCGVIEFLVQKWLLYTLTGSNNTRSGFLIGAGPEAYVGCGSCKDSPEQLF